MAFEVEVGQEIQIDGVSYHFAGNPVVPSIPFGQEGKAAVVYKLTGENDQRALKVFKQRFRVPSLVSLSTRLAAFADLPGLTVCRRSVLTSRNNHALLRQYPDLSYAVLMPWIAGPTWMDILLSREPLTFEQSHRLAHSFADVLCELEQQGIAHCDLSAPNLIIPMLAENAAEGASVELVDVEQLFARNLDEPEFVPIGTDGYAHHSIREGKIWNALADRFSGSILLAEMLGWCDPVVCQSAWGDSSYFEQNELQKPGPRYDRLMASIRKNWGRDTASLLSRAWASDLLADCPTFDDWLLAIPEKADGKASVTVRDTSQPILEEDHKLSPITTLLLLSEQMLASNNLHGALTTLQEVLRVSDTPKEQEHIQAKILNIQKMIAEQAHDVTQEPEEDPSDILSLDLPKKKSKPTLLPYLWGGGLFVVFVVFLLWGIPSVRHWLYSPVSTQTNIPAATSTGPNNLFITQTAQQISLLQTQTKAAEEAAKLTVMPTGTATVTPTSTSTTTVTPTKESELKIFGAINGNNQVKSKILTIAGRGLYVGSENLVVVGNGCSVIKKQSFSDFGLKLKKGEILVVGEWISDNGKCLIGISGDRPTIIDLNQEEALPQSSIKYDLNTWQNHYNFWDENIVAGIISVDSGKPRGEGEKVRIFNTINDKEINYFSQKVYSQNPEDWSFTYLDGIKLASSRNKIAYWGNTERWNAYILTTTSIWDYIEGGTKYHTFTDKVADMEFLANPGIVLIAKGKEVIAWNYETDEVVKTIYSNSDSVISELAISKSLKVMAIGLGNGQIVLFDLGANREIMKLESSKGRVTGLSFSSNDTLLGSFHENGTGILWYYYQ